MKVLVLVEGFYPKVAGGAISQWVFAQQLVERGHEVTVWTTRIDDTPRRETTNGVRIRRPYTAAFESRSESVLSVLSSMKFTVQLTGLLARRVRTADVDVIYSASHITHPVARVVGGLYDIPVVNFVAYTPSIEPDEDNPTNPLYLFEQLNFRSCMGDVVYSRTPTAKAAIERVADSRVRLIPGVLEKDRVRAAVDGVDPAGVRARFGVDPDSTFLASVGRLYPVKYPLAMLDVVAALPERYELVVVGDGPMRARLAERIETDGLGDRVHLAGQLPHDEALETIAASDGVVLTSRTEAYPTVVFEGLALGSSVFATPVGVLPEVVHPRLHVAEVDALPDAIREASFDGGHGVDEESLDDYSMERFTETVLDGMTDLCGSDPG